MYLGAHFQPPLVPLRWLNSSTIKAMLYADALRRQGSQRKLRNSMERLWGYANKQPPGGNGQVGSSAFSSRLVSRSKRACNMGVFDFDVASPTRRLLRTFCASS